MAERERAASDRKGQPISLSGPINKQTPGGTDRGRQLRLGTRSPSTTRARGGFVPPAYAQSWLYCFTMAKMSIELI